MALYLKDSEADAMAARLAARRGLTKTGAVKLALANELDRPDDARPLSAVYADLYARLPKPRPTGRIADKAFFDDLSGNP